MVDDNYAIIQVGDSSSMYAPVLAFVFPLILTRSTLNKDLLKPGCSVCIHPGSSAVVDILPPQADNDIKIMTEKPTVTYQDIGGLDVQKQELRESVELPLLHPEIFSQIGIDPPRGVGNSAIRFPVGADVRPSGNRQDHAGEGGGERHDGELHPGGGQRIRAEVVGRRPANGSRHFQQGARECSMHHLH